MHDGKKATAYETPRLQTYGKLSDLTKGNPGSGADGSAMKV